MTAILATTWIGTVPSWLTVGAVAIVGWFFVRGAGGTALSTLETANRVLEQEVNHLRHEVDTLRDKIAIQAQTIDALQQRTDISQALDAFEKRVVSRHKILAQALPDPVRTAFEQALDAEITHHQEG